MGYSERRCQLCGVSFNLGRIRTPDEPEEAAWLYYGSGFISAAPPYDECTAEGCSDGPRENLGYPPNNVPEREHIAGPDCECTQGYAGSRVGWEEMKERISVQCLAAKKEDWEPERGDEDFEIAAQYCFVTGISSEPPDEFEAAGLSPVKHDVSDTMIDNAADGVSVDDDGDFWAMPFHPACFQIFKRQSAAKTGTVDIDGLWKLREVAGDHFTRFKGLSLRPDVELTNSVQNCECHRGTEYLASTPLDIPALNEIMRGHAADTCDDIVFQPPTSNAPGYDPFDALSREFHLMLLPCLDMKDVANLRLTSRCFAQLPQAYFRHLIRTTMPWVWEAEDLVGKPVDWHRLWNELAVADGGSGLDEKQRHYENGSNTVLPDEGARIHAEIDAEHGLKPPDAKWHGVYQEKMRCRKLKNDALIEAERASGRWIPKRQLNEIKGLRNRRRIWEDIEEILRRIGKLTPGERGDDPEES